jgi:hypothetical protein
MGDTQNLQLFKERMQAAFRADTYRFFREIIMPLTPKAVHLLGSEGKGVDINIVLVNPQNAKQVIANEVNDNTVELVEQS